MCLFNTPQIAKPQPLPPPPPPPEPHKRLQVAARPAAKERKDRRSNTLRIKRQPTALSNEGAGLAAIGGAGVQV